MSEQQDTAKLIVGDDEIVYRLISSPAGYNEMTGVSPDCFKLFRKNESYVSVERALSKYTDSHPGHAGIQMKLSEGQVYKNKEGEPTPMEILALQTYLSGIVDQVVKKDSKKDQEQIVKESLTKAFDELHAGKVHHDARNLFKR